MAITSHLYVPRDIVRSAAALLGASTRETRSGPVLSLDLTRAARSVPLDRIPVQLVRFVVGGEAAATVARLSWWGSASGGLRQDPRDGVEVRSRWVEEGVLTVEARAIRGTAFPPGCARMLLGQVERALTMPDPLAALFEGPGAAMS
jgi:hypothetical protein